MAGREAVQEGNGLHEVRQMSATCWRVDASAEAGSPQVALIRLCWFGVLKVVEAPRHRLHRPKRMHMTYATYACRQTWPELPGLPCR